MRHFLILLLLAASAAAETPDFQAGMSYGAFSRDVFLSPESDQAVDSMRATNIEWVAVCAWWYQTGPSTTDIAPDPWGTPSDSALRHVIEVAHARGMKVMLKPMLDCRDGTWRALINPGDWSAWFAGYRAFIAHYAQMARDLNVEQFCVGCEFVSSSVHRPEDWLSVVDTVRSLYSGPLTYAANFWQEYELLTWWSALDAIGIDAYFAVSNHDSATVEEMAASWTPILTSIETFRDTMALTLPVIFTEIGCRSVVGAARNPWDWVTVDSVDFTEQANYYEAWFQAVLPRPWMKGIYWWWWDNQTTGDYRFGDAGWAKGYTPNGKSAQEVLREHYGSLLGVRVHAPNKSVLGLSASPNPFPKACRIELPPGMTGRILTLLGETVGDLVSGVREWQPPAGRSGIYIVEGRTDNGDVSRLRIVHIAR